MARRSDDIGKTAAAEAERLRAGRLAMMERGERLLRRAGALADRLTHAALGASAEKPKQSPPQEDSKPDRQG